VAAIVLLSVSALASSDDARLINLFDRYSPQKVVIIPPTTLIQDHM
jgi:hypothetical protein